MQILENMVIKGKYDAIVVGAGIGGITAGALLAKKGLSVLVIEQHYIPGGVCSTVKRQGVSMDAGAALLFGWGDLPDSTHLYIMNQLEEHIDMIPHEAIYRMHFGDKYVTFWKDFERYFQELVTAFPGKDDQFRGFYEELFSVYNLLKMSAMPMSPDTMPKSLGMQMFMKHPFKTLKLTKVMNQSLKNILDKHIQDPMVEGFFDLLIASCYCTKIVETPLMMGAAVVCNTHDGGAYYPAGSPQMLPNTIEKALEKYNGQVLYRNYVEEILVRDSVAYGVRLKDGTEIMADQIISDATVWNLYGKLINKRHLTDEQYAWSQRFVPCVSAVVLYIGVDASVIPKGTRSIEAFIGDLTILTKNNYFMYIPSVDDPSICPENMHSVSVLCSAGEYKWPRPWEPEYKSEGYKRMKQEFADKALSVIESRFPGFKEHIKFMEVATPSTIERFTLKNWGNIGGPKQMLGQHLYKRLGARSFIKNLYCVGDSCSMGEGVISVSASAVGAVNMMLEDRKLKIYLPTHSSNKYVHMVEGKPKSPLPSINEKLDEVKAKRTSNECQWCEDPKCKQNCPAGIDVPNFIRRIEVGNYKNAAQVIRENNPLGEVCGYICPAEKLCELKCNRLDFSTEQTRIKNLQAWVCEKAGADGWPQKSTTLLDSKIAIIGAGPAGLSCAYFLARLGYQVEIFEKDDKVGGMLSQVIPTARLPSDVLQRDLTGTTSFSNIKINYGKELGSNISIADLKSNYDAIFIAIGLNSGSSLDISGSKNVKMDNALHFLQEVKSKNKSTIGSRVLVIGGGSVAVDAADAAKLLGAKEITLVCLENESEMPCLKSEMKELLKNGINVFNCWGPTKFLNTNKLEFRKCTSVFDKKGKFCPNYDESDLMTLEFDDIIMAVGQTLDSKMKDYLTKEFGTPKISVEENSNCVKGQQNIFAGGDIIRGAGMVVQAVGDGRKSAKEIHDMLSKKKNNGC
jgi:carotene isomerase